MNYARTMFTPAIFSRRRKELYHGFLKNRLGRSAMVEVRLWAAIRCQSVAKTVIGSLQYGRVLASLPKIQEYYQHFPGKRVPEDHAEVILAHQTFGQRWGSRENDDAILLLMERFCDHSIVLVFDLCEGSLPNIRSLVDVYFAERGGFGRGAFEHASVKCRWDRRWGALRVIDVLPRMFPLRLGSGEYRTQGKASNQLNGLRFASGHCVQALDCNMGTFIGEAFKIPYVLQAFMPLDKVDRTTPHCRFLGFRESIYTSREGTVGKCHAAAEWAFGTIYQRFLSGMGMRMHYGHPDFLDGFWARNRGGMSKCSPAVNLSEDIFAGFNVHMRCEASPHIDALEFEKGREATFNSASGFFAKISHGGVSMLRSRDNHLLCERIGIIHSLSFYFASVAFYTSNLLVDISIYIYVALFVLFNLAGFSPGCLGTLGASFSTEWIVSMGLATLLPQVCEMVLEYGATHALYASTTGLFSSTCFFIFQNKNIASAMWDGAVTGIAAYSPSGRPMANQHQTWKDIYVSYWKSHYFPASSLALVYTVYCLLADENHGEGKLPLMLVVISTIAWVATPILFSPFPRWKLIAQDMHDFNGFITGGAGAEDDTLPEVVRRGKNGTVRTLYECGLADELRMWGEQPLFMLSILFIAKALMGLLLVAAIPSEVMDFCFIFLFVLSLSWVAVLGYFSAGRNKIFLVLSFTVWVTVPNAAHLVVGERIADHTFGTHMLEYVLAFAVFLYLLDLAKHLVLLLCRALHGCFVACCRSEDGATQHLQECIRLCFLYFAVHQIQVVVAYVVMLVNATVAGLLALVDHVGNAHTWWLLNDELVPRNLRKCPLPTDRACCTAKYRAADLDDTPHFCLLIFPLPQARTKAGEQYMENGQTFYELDAKRRARAGPQKVER